MIINSLINELVKMNYSYEEIESTCDSFYKTITNPIPIESIFDSIENEINEEERKYKTMYTTNTINLGIPPLSISALTTSGTIETSFLLTPDYKEEKNNKLIYGFNVPGIRIKCEEIWNNKERKLALHFYGENEIFNVKNCFDKTIDIDTDIYEKYDWTVKDSILYVTLFEKINERPDFHRVEKSKSPYKKKDVEATSVESENK